MSDLRFTDTNAADDSAGRAFGLEGNLYLLVVVALVAAVTLFGLAYFVLRLKWPIAGTVGSVPLIATLAWVLVLKHGKPAGYDRDFVENVWGRGHMTRTVSGSSLGRSHDGAPDGRFVDDMLLFGSPEHGGVIVKGFWVQAADLRGASNERKNAFQDQLRGLLTLVTAGRRIQLYWFPDADHRSPLLGYHEDTQPVEDLLIRGIRNERFSRYWPRMLRCELRCERLAVFVSVEIPTYAGNVRTRGGLHQHYGTLFREFSAQFDEFTATLRTVLGADTPVTPMGDLDHFACLQRFLNPSLASRGFDDPARTFDPSLSIQENCWHGEGVGQPEGGFFLDGHFHAILTLDRWPRQTRPGIVTHLTGIPIHDYAITVNVRSATARQEIHREEKAAERLRGEYSENQRPSLLVALRKKERKVEALSSGFSRPFHVTYVIRVWAPTKEALREKISTVQAAINAMAGAQYFECALPTTARKLFYATWPGWTHSSYHHRELYAEDTFLADMLPFSATFGGALNHAEALYDGSHGNLVGVATEAGGSPQHAVVVGMTGAGKSAFIEDLLFQTTPFFDYTLLIEQGLSYKRFTLARGETPIIIQPDGALTLNYLDTQRLPLTQLHLATAVALLARMVGEPETAEQLALRQAQLTQYLHQLYRDTFVDWARRRPAAAEEVRRLACAVHRWRERMPAGATPVEAFVDLRDRRAAREDKAIAFVAELPEETITRFAQEPATERLIAQTACAFYLPEEFPTHSALVELLAYARLPEHDKTEIDRLATLLRAWTADGAYGRLFDGITNVSLERDAVHFELGLIPDIDVGLKATAGLLISGLARQRILALPRAQRKRIIFEELSRFLDVPGGEQIVAESYEQLRKFNCWAVSIVQQYSRFRASRVRSAVIGNAKQFFLMRQSDRSDMADLARDLALPESALDAIQQYPMPEQQSPEKRYSSLCYFLPTAQPPQCGTLRHIQPKEDPCAPAS